MLTSFSITGAVRASVNFSIKNGHRKDFIIHGITQKPIASTITILVITKLRNRYTI